MPRYVERPVADAAGLRDDRDLPWQLPYNLQARAVFQTIEDLYEMLHEINGRLHDMGYDRLEELLDPAGFSGLVSRSVVDRFERASPEPWCETVTTTATPTCCREARTRETPSSTETAADSK